MSSGALGLLESVQVTLNTCHLHLGIVALPSARCVGFDFGFESVAAPLSPSDTKT